MNRGSWSSARSRFAGLQIGEVVADKYRIICPIGSGGMGTVYRAVHLVTGKEFALKAMHPAGASGPEASRRLIREAQAVGRIKHPNVVEIYDVIEHSDVPLLVMELLHGEPLDALLEREKTLPVTTAIDLLLHVVRGVSAAHKSGIIHRDLKPDNIFLCTSEDGLPEAVKVLDFGIAGLRYDGGEPLLDSLTETGAAMGTPLYMSPEQLMDSKRVDARSDIYSFGVILYLALCGRLPFVADTLPQLAVQIISQDPPSPSTLRSDLPPELDTIMRKALSREPEKRYASMRAVRDALTPFGSSPHQPRDSTQRWSLSTPTHSASIASSVKIASKAGPARVMTPGPALRQQSGRMARWWSSAFASYSRPRDAEVDEEQSDGHFSPDTRAHRRTQPPSISDSQPPSDSNFPYLPAEMQTATEAINAFITTLFGTHEQIAQGVLELDAVKIPNAGQYRYFAVFMASSSEQADNVMHTRTFMAYAKPLETYLLGLAPEKTKVILAITASHELGRGVREKIFDYLRRFDAIVVPLYVGEIKTAYAKGELRGLFDDRLTDFHAASNPFAPAVAFDATRCVGMRAELNALSQALHTRASVLVNVYGLPGSGKTSLIKLAEYGTEKLRFSTVRCSTRSGRDATLVARQIVKKLTGLVIPVRNGRELSVQELFTHVAHSLGGEQNDMVLVLEDADWLIDGLESVEQEFQAQVRTFWRCLAELLEDQPLRVVVTSIQGFMLKRSKREGWENPLANEVTLVQLHPLLPLDVSRYVRTLGAQLNMSFDAAALTELSRVSRGHLRPLQKLCTYALEWHRNQVNHHPLSVLAVTKLDIERGMRALAADESTYRDRELEWLNETEEQVLHVLAARKLKHRRAVQSALPERPPQEVAAALRRLRELGLINHNGTHDVHTIPLLEAWIKRHVDRDVDAPTRIRRRRDRGLTLGVSLTVLMLAAYTVLRTSDKTAGPVAFEGCQYLLKYPSHARRGKTFPVRVLREACSGSAHVVPLQITGSMTTTLKGTDGKAEVPVKLPCSTLRCEGPAQDIEVDFAQDNTFDVVLRSDQQHLVTATVQLDYLSALGASAGEVFKYASLFPALAALWWAFHGRVRTALGPLFGRGSSADDGVKKS